MKIILLIRGNDDNSELTHFLEGLGHEVILKKSDSSEFESQIKEAEYYYKNNSMTTISIDSLKENGVPNIVIYYGYGAYENKAISLESEKYSFINNTLYMIDNLTEYNFNVLIDRAIGASNSIESGVLEEKFGNIKGPCICIGNGGSYAASMFASKVLEAKNGVISIDKQPRDVLYNNINMYDNVLAVTYGNRNYGINRALEKSRIEGLDTYVLTTGKQTSYRDNLIKYESSLSDEYSFISVASTFMPMSVMLKYYCEMEDNELNDIIKNIYNNSKEVLIDDIDKMPVIEIMSGDNTYVASRLLESSITESGIGIPVVHEKYDYCHGRSNLSYYNKNSILIYLLNGEKTDLDKLLLKDLSLYYKQVVLLETPYKDKIIGEYDLSMKSIFLCKRIAESQKMDLCKFEYSPVVKKVYRFNKGM